MHVLDLTLTALPENVSPARQYIRRYLDEIQIGDDQYQDVLTALGEALTNTVEHAYFGSYPGPFHVQASISNGDHLVVTVKDEGRWKQQTFSSERGHGTMLMQMLSEECKITCDEKGTVVRLSFPLVDQAHNLLSKAS
jgi:anti-sigma regulatory factor (Ser/Thr protein kinase)